MNSSTDLSIKSTTRWGPYKLSPNPRAILRLSLGTAAAIATVMLVPDAIALSASTPNFVYLISKSLGLWGYVYIGWASCFVAILNLLRIFGGGIVLDNEGIKLGRFGSKVLWGSIEAVSIAERKLFSRLIFVPAYQMTIHAKKIDGKFETKQIASFQYTSEEFFSLFYNISERSLHIRPASVDAFVFKNIRRAELRSFYESGKLKNLALTAVIAFGLVSYMARNAVKNYTFNMGNQEFAQGHYDKAISYFSVPTSIEFSYAPAWEAQARCEYNLGDFAAAENDWKNALKWKPDYVEAKLGLADIYMEQGKLEQAQGLILTANRLAPLNESAYMHQVQIELLMGQLNVAMQRLQPLVLQGSTREDALLLLARAQLKEGRLKEAKSSLVSANFCGRQNLSSSAPAGQSVRASILPTIISAEIEIESGNFDEAEKLLQPLRLIANHDLRLMIDQARISLARKDFVTAERHLAAAEVLSPKWPYVAICRAEMALAQNNLVDVDKYLKQAEAFRFADPCIYALCARLYQKSGNEARALDLAQKAINIDSNNMVATMVLAKSGEAKK
jgi:predicted Zn-dependent protease